VIQLGPGNEEEARSALRAYPGGLQLGGGVNASSARSWLDDGASHVIVTSWVFREGRVDWLRLRELAQRIGVERLVLDLSCRKQGNLYCVVTDRWQRFTDLVLGPETFARFVPYCAEFLVHAVDVEGLCRGIDAELVRKLAGWSSLPVTYAGGASSLSDLELVAELGQSKVDLTIGSALDIFGGAGVRYRDAVEFDRRMRAAPGLRTRVWRGSLMGELQFIPWVLAAITGAVLAWVGYRSRGAWAPWAIGGAIYALVISTIVIGLFHASFLPLSEAAESSMHLKATLFSLLLILAVGALFTFRMWREAFAPKQLPEQTTPSWAQRFDKLARRGTTA
jgi:phosphoribosylformimino-5-aminoimidazole carboxamide ribotide isomerase